MLESSVKFIVENGQKPEQSKQQLVWATELIPSYYTEGGQIHSVLNHFCDCIQLVMQLRYTT